MAMTLRAIPAGLCLMVGTMQYQIIPARLKRARLTPFSTAI